MKFSLTLRSRRPLTRSEARACLAANLALPGAGSLAAGRAIGYAQMALSFGGFILSVVAGIPMIEWAVSNWSRMTDSSGDPGTMLSDLWRHARWPLFGIVLFVVALIWSAATGMKLVSAAPQEGVPPRINPN
jgi:hypothetical protein